MSKTTTKTATTKTTVTKMKVQKASPTREAYKTLNDELKRLSDEKKAKKTELLQKIDAMWKDYQKYTKESYRAARTAAIEKFNAVKKDAKAKRAAVKTAKPKAKTAKKVIVKNTPTVDVKPEVVEQTK